MAKKKSVVHRIASFVSRRVFWCNKFSVFFYLPFLAYLCAHIVFLLHLDSSGCVRFLSVYFHARGPRKKCIIDFRRAWLRMKDNENCLWQSTIFIIWPAFYKYSTGISLFIFSHNGRPASQSTGRILGKIEATETRKEPRKSHLIIPLRNGFFFRTPSLL